MSGEGNACESCLLTVADCVRVSPCCGFCEHIPDGFGDRASNRLAVETVNAAALAPLAEQIGRAVITAAIGRAAGDEDAARRCDATAKSCTALALAWIGTECDLDERRLAWLTDMEWDSCPTCAAIVCNLSQHTAWHDRTDPAEDSA